VSAVQRADLWHFAVAKDWPGPASLHPFLPAWGRKIGWSSPTQSHSVPLSQTGSNRSDPSAVTSSKKRQERQDDRIYRITCLSRGRS